MPHNTSRYHSKDLGIKTVEQVRKDFKHLLRELDFFENIDLGRRSALQVKPNEAALRQVADYAAACAVRLQESKWLKDAAISRALEYSDSLIEDLGYRITSFRELQSTLAKERDHHVVLVPGCQTPVLYESRVHALRDLLRVMPVRFTIVFSGRRPESAKTVQTRNEARSMNRYFETIMDSVELEQHKRLEIYLEEKANNTPGNIKKFMTTQGVILRGKTNHVTLISSSFHVPRLAKTFEDYIRRRKISSVKTVMLSSAEPMKPNPVSRDPRYLKSLFYEVFADALLRQR